MKRFTLLGFFVSSLCIACGDGTLEPIVTGAGGSGAGQPSGPGGAGGGPTDTAPVLVYAHKGGIRTFRELQEIPPLPDDGGPFGLVPGIPVGVGQVGHDLLMANHYEDHDVVLGHLPGFALGEHGLLKTKELALPPVGDSPQRASSISGDASGSIWLTTGPSDPLAEISGNTLRWSPSGNIDGPWVVHESSPAILSWVLLPDQSTIIANLGLSIVVLHVDRQAEQLTIEQVVESFPAWRAFEVYEGTLYGVTSTCMGGADCSDTGELHIWRDLESFSVYEPTAIIDIPETSSYACSLTVSDAGAAVGTCIKAHEIPEPRLYLFREPAALVTGAQPDESIVLEDSAIELVSHAWHDDFHQRTVSIFMRDTVAGVFMFDDEGGVALQARGTLAEVDHLGRDLLLVH